MKENKISDGLKNSQQLTRQHTINKVLRAISDLKSENKQVTITNLVDYTELSRSVFSKPHIREILMEYGYENNCSVNKAGGKKKSKNNVIEAKDVQIEKLRERNAELERECELLRGRLFLAMQRNC